VSVPAADSARLDEYADIIRETFRRLEQDLSIFRPDSEISLLNRSSGGAPVPVTGHTSEALALCLKYGRISGGAFDPTVGPLVSLWGFGDGTPRNALPDPDSLQAALELVGYRRIFLSNAAETADGTVRRYARLEVPRMSVNLGGMAKGYAVDVACRRLADTGAGSYMVNLGGNMRCVGTAREGVPWNIGIQDPFHGRSIIGTISLTGGMAAATSGNYEQFVTIGNRRYTHIIDPRSGNPVSGMAGVTVISPSATEADAMSTALFVAGPAGSTAMLERLGTSHALFVPDEQPVRILVTPGFQKYFTPSPAFADHVQLIDHAIP